MAKSDELTRADKTRRRAGLLLAAAALAVAIAGGAWFAVTQLGASDGTPEPADSTVVNPESMAVIEGFLDASNAYDTDRALTYLDADAGPWESREWIQQIPWNEAVGYEEIINDCEQLGDTGRIQCTFDYHWLRSDEIGLGPYSDNTWTFTLRDDSIVFAERSQEHVSNGFYAQMWLPFAEWVSTSYPDDAAVMYVNSRRQLESHSDESIALWEQHTREYVDLNR